MVLNQRLVRFCRQTAPKAIQEVQTYAWDAKAAQRGEEKPLKIRDHGPGAFRYFAKSEVPYWTLGSNWTFPLIFVIGLSRKDYARKCSEDPFDPADDLLIEESATAFRS